MSALENQGRKLAIERQKFAEERKSAKAEQAEYEEWKKLKADKLRNPDKYLKADYGENYYDLITKLKVEGAPPADLIASEMDERFKSVEQRLAEKEAALEKRLQDIQAQEARKESDAYLSKAVDYVKSNAEKYEWLNFFGEQARVTEAIRAHYTKTAKRNADGSIEPGEVLSYEKAAEMLEKEISEIGEKFKKRFEERAAKAASDGKEKAKPSIVEAASFTKRTEPTPRRESTNGEQRTRTERERWLASMKVGDDALASRAN